MKLDIGRCMELAWDVFLKNWLILIVAGLLYTVLSVATLLILMGPLTAGLSLLALKALEREDHRVDLGDMFGMFHRFLGLVGMFFLTLVATVVGLALCVAPGLFLLTIWIFPFLILVDQQAGVFDSLVRSQELVFRAGFWKVFALMLVELALSLLPEFVPVAGAIVSFATTPLAFLVVAAAYRQLATSPPLESNQPIAPAM
ncbi:MAG: hypothetical protein ACKV0T_09335 [Planctomycetales bacterium]